MGHGVLRTKAVVVCAAGACLASTPFALGPGGEIVPCTTLDRSCSEGNIHDRSFKPHKK